MLQAGALAPEILIGSFSLRETLREVPVLLVFFKVSCPTCQFTLPFLQRLPLRVEGISQDNAEATREFSEYFGITFPIELDDIARGYPASNAYAIHYVPSLFLVGQTGRVEWSVNGFHREELRRLGERFGGSIFREAERVPAMRPG